MPPRDRSRGSLPRARAPTSPSRSTSARSSRSSTRSSPATEVTAMSDADRAAAKILIVDDEPTNVRLLERLLKAASYGNVMSTTDAREAVGRYRTFQPDIVLLDLMMPHLDGVAVLGQLRAEMPSPGYLPILILTADVSLDAKSRALAAGASDFLTKPFERIEVLLRIGNPPRPRPPYPPPAAT